MTTAPHVLAGAARPPLPALVLVTGGAVIGLLVGMRGLLGVVLVLAAAALLVLLVVPHHSLWWIALGFVVLVPWSVVPGPALLQTISPAVVVVVVLALRLAASGAVAGPLRSHVALLVLLGIWVAATAAWSVQAYTTAGWVVAFVSLALLPAVLGSSDTRAVDHLTGAWATLGVVVGAYSVVEVFVLGGNPLLDAVYSATGNAPPAQAWSTYRATATFGHPVPTGMFLTAAVPLCLGRLLKASTPTSFAAVAVTVAGVIATGSRAALIGVTVGCLVVLALTPRGRRAGVHRIAATAALLAVLGAGAAVLVDRSTSPEATSSATYRVEQIDVAAEQLDRDPLGVGAGTAAVAARGPLAARGSGAFESMWLELLVATGYPGLVLGAAVLTGAVALAARAGAPAVAGALLAWITGGSAYNVLEGGREGLLYIGVLLAMAFSAQAAHTHDLQVGRPR